MNSENSKISEPYVLIKLTDKLDLRRGGKSIALSNLSIYYTWKNIVDFNGTNATDSFNSNAKITGQTDNDGEIDNVETMFLLKYFNNFGEPLKCL